MRTASVFPTSTNDNLPAQLAADAAEALANLRAFVVPDRAPGGSTGNAFARLRLAVLADHAIAIANKRRNPRTRRQVTAGAAALGEASCSSPLDFAMKAVMLRALVSASAAYAATSNDPAAIMLDADTLADLMAAMAADALALAEGVTS